MYHERYKIPERLGYTDFHMIKILTMNRASNTGQSDI